MQEHPDIVVSSPGEGAGKAEITMEYPNRAPEVLGSATPGLEGAPSTQTHENRNKSVILTPQPGAPAGEEGSPSKP